MDHLDILFVTLFTPLEVGHQGAICAGTDGFKFNFLGCSVPTVSYIGFNKI